MENTMLNDIKEVLYSEAYIDSMVKRVGAEISRDYADKNLLLVSVLKGSVVFMADLMRAITIPARIELRLRHEDLRRCQDHQGPRHQPEGL